MRRRLGGLGWGCVCRVGGGASGDAACALMIEDLYLSIQHCLPARCHFRRAKLCIASARRHMKHSQHKTAAPLLFHDVPYFELSPSISHPLLHSYTVATHRTASRTPPRCSQQSFSPALSARLLLLLIARLSSKYNPLASCTRCNPHLESGLPAHHHCIHARTARRAHGRHERGD